MWVWVIVAFVVGGIFGFLVVSLITAQKIREAEYRLKMSRELFSSFFSDEDAVGEEEIKEEKDND